MTASIAVPHTPEAHGRGPIDFTVVKGNPTDEEVAALSAVLAELWAKRLWERDTRRHPRDLWRAGDKQLSFVPGGLPQSFMQETPPAWRGA
ncbi:MAG: acyl-CoA carboxylase subunit epsilon [Segniliparus sp.]|uniref:acyl-CoA carboxylase subunit epsilon n=1 Tax=Segniliparus sp. TaxID=2804064 RepID=UPI003F2FBD59